MTKIEGMTKTGEGYVVRDGRRIAIETYCLTTTKPKRARKGQFVLVPILWTERLQRARNLCTFKLALHLLFQHWKSGGKPVSVSNVVASRLGIGDKKARYRALRELERLELVIVQRHPRRVSKITVLQI